MSYYKTAKMSKHQRQKTLLTIVGTLNQNIKDENPSLNLKAIRIFLELFSENKYFIKFDNTTQQRYFVQNVGSIIETLKKKIRARNIFLDQNQLQNLAKIKGFALLEYAVKLDDVLAFHIPNKAKFEYKTKKLSITDNLNQLENLCAQMMKKPKSLSKTKANSDIFGQRTKSVILKKIVSKQNPKLVFVK